MPYHLVKLTQRCLIISIGLLLTLTQSSCTSTKSFESRFPKGTVTNTEDNISNRITEAQGRKDYESIYNILHGLLTAKSDDFIRDHLYSHNGDALIFLESAVYKRDPKIFARLYGIASNIVTGDNARMLALSYSAWTDCGDIYVKATREYLDTRDKSVVDKYKPSCNWLYEIYR